MKNTKQNIETSCNQKFWIQLEFTLCGVFAESKDPELKNFWCDGFSLYPTDSQLSKKHVNDKRKINTKAWIGKTEQEVYQATIYFGKKALSRYAIGTDLTDCIPELDSKTEWIDIDIENRTIEIRLY